MTPWGNTDEEFLRSALFKYRGPIRACGLEEEDVAQDARLSLVRRPIPAGLSGASRRWNVQNRVVDVLHKYTVRPLPNRTTGAKGRFRVNMDSLDALLDRGAGFQDQYDGGDALLLRVGQTTPPTTPDPALRKLVQRLPRMQRTVILRLFWGDEMGVDIARDLGISTQGVSRHKARALQALRERMT